MNSMPVDMVKLVRHDWIAAYGTVKTDMSGKGYGQEVEPTEPAETQLSFTLHASTQATGAGGPLWTPEQAAARMLERRKFHSLPDGMSIRDLMTF